MSQSPRPTVVVPRPKATVAILSHRKGMVIEALASALAQTEPNVQVLVQYCPTNWTDKLAQMMRLAEGEWVIPLCDDDLLAPTYVERCLQAGGQADVVVTDRICFKDGADPTSGSRQHQFGDGFEEGKAYAIPLSPDSFMYGATLPPTVMVRKQCWDRLGGWDAQLPHADTEFLYRCCAAGMRFVYVAEPLFLYRIHPANESQLHNTMPAAMAAFHDKHYDTFGLNISQHDQRGYLHGMTLPPCHRAITGDFS